MNSKEVRSNNKACDKTVSKAVFRHFTGVKFFTCPSNYNQDSFAHWFTLARHFQDGIYPLDLDGPNKNIEALHFVESLQNNFHSEKMREVNGR
jgi:hypothetical protein